MLPGRRGRLKLGTDARYCGVTRTVLAPALADYLRGLGLGAEAVAPDDDDHLERGLLRRDLGYVRLRDRAVALVTLRLRSHRSIVALPFVARSTHTYDLHHIVRVDPSADPVAFEARLALDRRHGRVRSAVWVGGAAAARIGADEATTRELRELLGVGQRLSVAPDPRHRCVRIVHRTRLRVGVSLPALLRDEGVAFDHGMPSRALLDAIDRVAARVATVSAARASR